MVEQQLPRLDHRNTVCAREPNEEVATRKSDIALDTGIDIFIHG
jgi:hypothetical protein